MAGTGAADADPDEVFKRVQLDLVRKMHRIGGLVSNHAKRLVSRSQPTRVSGGRRGKRQRGRRSGRRIGLAPSLPGEPPKVLTGTLRANIGWAVQPRSRSVVLVIGVRKGPADKYARRLELGFHGTDKRGRKVNQAPRPFLRRAFLEKSVEAGRLLAA